MEEWDPIGVRDIPEASDEYDSYLGPIASRLRKGATADELAAYLTEVEEVQMGLGESAAAQMRNRAVPASPGTFRAATRREAQSQSADARDRAPARPRRSFLIARKVRSTFSGPNDHEPRQIAAARSRPSVGSRRPQSLNGGTCPDSP